ncbi:MAG TPA: dihydroorotate dehydrogenase-like protein [Bacteroidales bacterium]|nr:dihydroorotate dehydrogenase-like protein [Bacteroidales bacterium]HPS72258.1 dihydroorotate dehydrogenase-like protein [Bacteroidales bacterium]
MASLKTNYAGLTLENPVVIASCGFTGNIESIKKVIEFQPGAIVLKSLFEEQILAEAYTGIKQNEYDYPESLDYIKQYTRMNNLSKYLELVSETKKITSIPIIASINCVTATEWIEFAKEIQKAGADAIELNISILSTNPDYSAEQNEKIYFDIIKKINEFVTIPVTIKVSNNSSGLAHLLRAIDRYNIVKGFVLFNKHYCPDIDIHQQKIVQSHVLSFSSDYPETLRWTAIMSGKLKHDIVATTGIFNGETAVKFLLAGAKAVQISSVLYKQDLSVIQTIKDEISAWMDQNGYKTLSDFTGKLSMDKVENPEEYERIQFMKYFASVD